jgi:hypothetical protein
VKAIARTDVEAEALAAVDRAVTPFVDMLRRYPAWREEIAYVFLGSAIALADSMGCDVEGFLEGLRKQCPKAAVLVPPRSS